MKNKNNWKKIKSAVTDSGGIVKFDKENKLVSYNLLTIYSSSLWKNSEEIEKQCTKEQG